MKSRRLTFASHPMRGGGRMPSAQVLTVANLSVRMRPQGNWMQTYVGPQCLTVRLGITTEGVR